MEQWRKGVFIALVIHVILLVLVVFGPDILESRRKQEQIYTVKLFEPVRQPVVKNTASASRPFPRQVSVKTKHRIPPASEKFVKHPAAPDRIAKKVKPSGKKPVHVKKISPAVISKKLVSLNPDRKKPVKVIHKPVLEKPEKTTRTGPSREELLQKRIAAIKKRVKEKEEEKRLEQRLRVISQKVKKQQAALKGQAGTAVSSARGSADSINEVIAMYGMEVSQRVWRRWNLPARLIDQKGLEAIIEIKISESGRVLATRFEKSSGNMLFDRSAMRAVKDASPVPPLPIQLRPGPLVMGIRFRPEDR